jgi:hypothetical protein
MSRTESYTSLAVNTVFIFATNQIIFSIVTMSFVSALVNANLATDASV